MANGLSPFKDSDPKILAARKIAHEYMRKCMLHTPGVYGSISDPRNLQTTLLQDLNLDGDEAMFPAEIFAPNPLKITPDREYNPDRERQETQRRDEQAKEDANKKHFKKLYDVVAALADEKTPSIPPDDFYETMLPVLKNAPAFIASTMLSQASRHEVEAKENLGKIDEISRAINAQFYPNLPPHAAEFSRTDARHTKEVLQYTYDSSKVMELALQRFFGAVNDINAVFSCEKGKGKE